MPKRPETSSKNRQTMSTFIAVSAIVAAGGDRGIACKRIFRRIGFRRAQMIVQHGQSEGCLPP